MAPTFPHVRLVASGTLGSAGGNEIWSCGLKVIIAAPGAPSVALAPQPSDLVQLANVGLLGWENWVENGADGYHMSSDVLLTACKASAVAANGLDDPLISSVVDDAATSMRGMGPAGLIPYPVAVAITLRGATYQRGAAALGRFYIPGPVLSGLSNGLLSTARALSFANKAKALINFINTVGTGAPATTLTSGRIPIVANISTSAAESGLRWQSVNRVIVDTRPDTIRRRSNKIAGLGSQSVNLAD